MVRNLFFKFGKEKFLRKILDGNLRFTPAKTYQEEEQKSSKRGMGDQFDSYLKFKFTTAELQALGYSAKLKDNCLQVICDDCVKIPMLCFYRSSENQLDRFRIKRDDLKRIIKDFNNPDSVLIIKDEKSFLESVENELMKTVFCKNVVYLVDNILNYNYDALMSIVNGLESETDFVSPKSNGESFYNFNFIEGTPSAFCIDHTNSYSTMFFKHDYFSVQKEFRLVIPGKQVNSPVTKKISPLIDAEIHEIKFMEGLIL